MKSKEPAASTQNDLTAKFCVLQSSDVLHMTSFGRLHRILQRTEISFSSMGPQHFLQNSTWHPAHCTVIYHPSLNCKVIEKDCIIMSIAQVSSQVPGT